MNSAYMLVLVYSCPLFIFKKKKERVSLVVSEQRRTSTLGRETVHFESLHCIQWILSSDETVRAFTTWSRVTARLAK